jgi:hypothetical protein
MKFWIVWIGYHRNCMVRGAIQSGNSRHLAPASTSIYEDLSVNGYLVAMLNVHDGMLGLEALRSQHHGTLGIAGD